MLEAFPIPAGHLAAVGDLAAEVVELAEQYPGLQFVKPAVHAELHGLSAPIPAIEAAAPCRLDILGPVHHQGAAIAEGGQVFGGVEAEGGEASHADRLPFQELADSDPQKGWAGIADTHPRADCVDEPQDTGAETANVAIETVVEFGG